MQGHQAPHLRKPRRRGAGSVFLAIQPWPPPPSAAQSAKCACTSRNRVGLGGGCPSGALGRCCSRFAHGLTQRHPAATGGVDHSWVRLRLPDRSGPPSARCRLVMRSASLRRARELQAAHGAGGGVVGVSAAKAHRVTQVARAVGQWAGAVRIVRSLARGRPCQRGSPITGAGLDPSGAPAGIPSSGSDGEGCWGEETAGANAVVGVDVGRVIAVPVGGAGVVRFVEPGTAAQQLGDPPSDVTVLRECGQASTEAMGREQTMTQLEGMAMG